MKQTMKLILMAIGFGLLLGSQVWATDVTLVLEDQNASPIAGSKFIVDGGTPVPQGGLILLTSGIHTISIHPGMFGNEQLSLLSRVNTITVGTGPAQTVTLEWPTATFDVDLVDQFAVSIPGSQVGVGNVTPLLPTPWSIVLPVTDDPAEPRSCRERMPMATGWSPFPA